MSYWEDKEEVTKELREKFPKTYAVSFHSQSTYAMIFRNGVPLLLTFFTTEYLCNTTNLASLSPRTYQDINITRTKRLIRSEAKSKLFLRTELYINKNSKNGITQTP